MLVLRLDQGSADQLTVAAVVDVLGVAVVVVVVVVVAIVVDEQTISREIMTNHQQQSLTTATAIVPC